MNTRPVNLVDELKGGQLLPLSCGPGLDHCYLDETGLPFVRSTVILAECPADLVHGQAGSETGKQFHAGRLG